MTDSSYDPNAPEVLEFIAERDAALPRLSDRNRIVNCPWPEGSDSPLELRLKRVWRRLRCLPEEPLAPQI